MINLLPEEVKEDMLYGRKNRQILNWITTAVFGVVILFVIAAVGRLTIQTARNQALTQKENMEQQLKVADFEAVSDEYGGYVDGLGSVKKLYGQQILYTRLLRKLGTLLPAGARLTNISLSDKDRAIGLNFNNDADDLGPVIQLNLTDQSKQVSNSTRSIFNESIRVPLTGAEKAGEIAPITEDKPKKTLSYFVHSPNDTMDERLVTSAKSGGDMAFTIIYDALDGAKHLVDYKILLASKKAGSSTKEAGKFLAEAKNTDAQPQVRSYAVRPNFKAVDISVTADSLVEAKQIERTILGARNSIFIETYTFEDKKHPNKNGCLDEITKETVCRAVCRDGMESCPTNTKTCVAQLANGCRYIIRAYYDELYSSMTVRETTVEEKEKCSENPSAPPCTHMITATYSQLFSNVDTNRVAACNVDVAANTTTCPVEMRAEFSEDAKFYLINSGVAK